MTVPVKMKTVKITVAYDGTAYKGWQSQKNWNTIQSELEKAVSKVIGIKQTVHGAGRTDSGVHALGQSAHFKVPANFPINKISLALNSVLPNDIAVKKTEKVHEDFHARFDAVSKLYSYRIFSSTRRDPFVERYAWRVLYPLDPELMQQESRVLKGEHNFRSFQASDKRERPPVRTVENIDVKKTGSIIRIDIEGNGFLYNMVRNIAGTLVDIGRGYLPPGSMRKILTSHDRKEAGPTAPAKGLFLVKVKY